MNVRNELLMTILIVMAILLLGATIIALPDLPRAQVESRLYNQKFNTNYTMWDFFFARSTIKEFLNSGKQTTQNININGAIPVEIINQE